MDLLDSPPLPPPAEGQPVINHTFIDRRYSEDARSNRTLYSYTGAGSPPGSFQKCIKQSAYTTTTLIFWSLMPASWTGFHFRTASAFCWTNRFLSDVRRSAKRFRDIERDSGG